MAGKIRKGLIILISLCMAALFRTPAWAAQEPIFRLNTDNLNLQKGVSCTIVVSLINAQDAQIISIDGLENFDLLSQSQSTSTSIINNAATYQVDIYLTIMPKVTGQFTLKANIKSGGGSYETNTLEVTVTEGSNNNNGTLPSIFAKTIASHTEAYLGEKIVLTYELYSTENIDSLGFTDYVSIDGVISKEITTDQIKTEIVYVDGVRYTKYEVKQLIIDPINTGICTVPSFNLQVNVITESGINGGFGGFGGLMRSTTPRYLQTEEKELLVKPLPAEGKPDNFSGIVGQLNLNGNYSRNELNYGDSLVLKIEASGNCNLDALKNITGGGITGFSIYETQKDTVESVIDNQYHVKKAFETILIPEKTGELKAAPVSISYFNPATGKYETAKIPETTINVLGDMPIQSINDGSQAGSIETVFINQVSYADASGNYLTLQISKEWVYAALTGFCIIIFLSAILLGVVLSRKKRNTALRIFYKQLMGTNDINEIYNLFNAMIKHCFNINLKASSQNIIRSSLPDADLAVRVTDVMDYVESAEAHGDKGHIQLKNKIKGIYTALKIIRTP